MAAMKHTTTLIASALLLMGAYCAHSQNIEVPERYRWNEKYTKGSKSVYICYTKPSSGIAIYENHCYDSDKILNEYPPYAFIDLSFPGYRTDLHDVFLGVMESALGRERIAQLAERDESFYVGFDLDQDGNILMINFKLDTATLISPDELYAIETGIKKSFVFKPIKRYTVKLSGGFGIRTTFKEILAREIPCIRREEEQQLQEIQRVYGE